MKPYREWTELELFEAVGRGDEGAFRELKARIERITRACDRGPDRADLEEVAGRAFLKLESLRQRGFSGNNRVFRTHLGTRPVLRLPSTGSCVERGSFSSASRAI